MSGINSMFPYNYDATDPISRESQVITIEQVINIFNTYITNTSLSALLDVDDLLGNAPEGSVLYKGATEWTYEELSSYALTPATASVLGGVKIGSGITVQLDGTISVSDNYEYWTLGAGFSQQVKYGILYNWYAATDVRNIAADGWSVPSEANFVTLQTYLGGISVAGGKMKEIGTTYWDSPNTGATNESGFNGRGSGERYTGDDLFLKTSAVYFTTDIRPGLPPEVPVQPVVMVLSYNTSTFQYSYSSRLYGSSIRLIKNSTTLTNGQTGTYTGNDGKVYRTICIGTQEWMSENLTETKYRNGDVIPEVTNNSAWSGLTTGALCAYNNDWANAYQNVGITSNIERHELLNILAGDNISVSLDGANLTIGCTYDESDPIFTAWDRSAGITITESQISDLGAYIEVETDPIFAASAAYGITLSDIANWNSNTTYTHPTQSAINPTLTGANVLAALSVNTLGHVTSATSRVLTLANLGFTDAGYVHIAGTEIITGAKTFSNTTNFDKIISYISNGDVAINATSDFVGVQGNSNGIEGYGVVGMASYIPLQGTTLDTSAIGRRIGLVLNGDSANTTVAVGYAIDMRWDLPWTGNLLNKPAGWMSLEWTDITLNAESSRFKWYARNAGVESLAMTLSGAGKLTIPSLNLSSGTSNKFLYLDSYNDVTFVDSPAGVMCYRINLPNAASVAARCAAAIEGVDYPTGWTIGAWIGNPNDIVITHTLGRELASATVFYDMSGGSYGLLIGNAAFSGISTDLNTIKIEALATIAFPISINLILV